MVAFPEATIFPVTANCATVLVCKELVPVTAKLPLTAWLPLVVALPRTLNAVMVVVANVEVPLAASTFKLVTFVPVALTHDKPVILKGLATTKLEKLPVVAVTVRPFAPEKSNTLKRAFVAKKFVEVAAVITPLVALRLDANS